MPLILYHLEFVYQSCFVREFSLALCRTQFNFILIDHSVAFPF